MFRKTFLHEFPIFYCHSEWNLLSSLSSDRLSFWLEIKLNTNIWPRIYQLFIALVTFEETGCWGFCRKVQLQSLFHFHLLTVNFSLAEPAHCVCEESNGCENEDTDHLGIPVSFDIRIKDYDNPMEEYILKRVHGRNGQNCSFTCSNIKFTSQQVYRGQKASMIAQKCLGQRIDGKNSQVYCGPISVTVSTSEQPRHWVL